MNFTFSRTVFIEASPGEVLEWCRSREARGYWPGAVEIRSVGRELRYDVVMAISGIASARLSVAEFISPIDSWEGGGELDTEGSWRWPGGDDSRVWSTYHCETLGSGTELELTMRIDLPETVHGEALDTDRLSRAISHAAAHYLDAISRNVHAPRRPGDGYTFRITARTDEDIAHRGS